MSFARWSKPLTLLAMCLGLFMPQIDTNAVNLALPSIQRSLHTDVGALQWIIDSYNLMFASLLVTGGTLGDLFGRKRLFLVGVVLFTLASLICGFAPTLPILVLGRVLQGVGAALELPGTLSILSVTYPDPHERTRAIAIWASVLGLALAVGPTVGAFLVDTFGWQSIFFLNLPFGLLTLVITLSVVRESSHPEGRHIDLPGQVLLALGLVTLTYAVIESQALGWGSPLIIGCLVLSLLSLGGFVMVERHTSGPMVPLDIFRQRTFSFALTIASMMTFGMYGLFFLISLYLQTIKHNTPLMAGLQYLPLSITFVLLSPVTGRLMNRFGPRWLMAIGMGLMGCGLLLFTSLATETSYTFLIATMALIGVGLAFNTGPVMAAAVGAVSPARAGLASGLGNVARMLGATLGVAVLGAIFASHLAGSHEVAPFLSGLHAAFLVGGCVELLGSLLAILCIPRWIAPARLTPSEESVAVSAHL